jgi:hypothetical protein
MKYKSDFFNESCLECFSPSTKCPKIEKMKCYIEWADKKITYQKNITRKCKIKIVEISRILLEE